MSLHNSSGPLSRAVSLAVSAVLNGLDMLERQFDESPLFDKLTYLPLHLGSGGTANLPSAAGSGIGVDPRMLAANADTHSFAWSF